MSDIYFYTDLDSIVEQLNDASTGEAFGPVTNTVFQLTSRHKALPDKTPKAIAVTSGTIVAVACSTIEDNVNVDYLTLILKPDYHLLKKAGLSVPEIKYIIYKGIQKNSIVNNTNNSFAAATSNDLTKRIRDNQTKFNNAFGLTGEPSLKILGLNPDSPFNATDDIEKLFTDNNVHELVHVSAGDHIGNFFDTSNASLFGVEFVFNSVRTKITFEEIWALNHKIDLSTITGAARIKKKKEDILKFIDPTAFYGALFSANRGNDVNDIKIRVKVNPVDPEAPKEVVFFGLDVYENLLFKLANKNKIYFDIRNEYNQSFNYQNIYSAPIKLKLGHSADFTEDTQYTNWPLIIIDHTTNSFKPSSTSEEKVEISLKLPFPTIKDDNKKPLLLSYLNYKEISGSKPNIPDKELPFIRIDKPLDNEYCKRVKFELPNYKTISAEQPVKPVCSYVRLKVFRTESTLQSDNLSTRQENHLDTLFLPFAVKKISNFPMEIRTFDEDVFMGTTFDIDNASFNEQNFPLTDYTSSVGYAFEASYVTYFAYANKRITPIDPSPIEFKNVEFSDNGDFLNFVSDKYREGVAPIIGNISLDMPSFPGQALYRYKTPLQTAINPDKVDLSKEFSAISLTIESYNLLKNAVTPGDPTHCGIDPQHDIFLVLKNRSKTLTAIVGDSLDEHYFNTYDIFLRGYQEDAAGNVLTTIEWDSGIQLISYSEEGMTYNGESKSMVLIEPGVALTDSEPDYYLPCNRRTLTATQVFDLKNFIDRLINSGYTHTSSDLVRKNVFRKSSEAAIGYYFYLDESTGEVFFKDNSNQIINRLPNYQLKGYIMEAATMFAVWNLCSLLSDPTEDNYVYNRLINCLLSNDAFIPESIGRGNGTPYPDAQENLEAIKARLFNPFLCFGQSYQFPDPIEDTINNIKINNKGNAESYVFIYPIHHNGPKDVNRVKIKNSYMALSPLKGILENYDISKDSFKTELFNLIRSGNYKPISSDEVLNSAGNPTYEFDYENPFNTSSEIVFFKIPNDTINSGILATNPAEFTVNGTNMFHFYSSNLSQKSLDFIEPIIAEISCCVNAEFQSMIRENAVNFYNVFTKNLNFVDNFPPELQMLATGEGSVTNGLTYPAKTGDMITFQGLIVNGSGTPGSVNSDPRSLGGLMFTYMLDDKGNTQLFNEQELITISQKTTVALHLSIYGLNEGNAPSIVEVELEKQGSLLDKSIVMRFVADPKAGAGGTNERLVPEPSLLTDTPLTPAPRLHHTTLPTKEQRVRMVENGTRLEFVEGAVGTSDDDYYIFKDVNDNEIATYYPIWGNLVLNETPTYSIKLRLFSGQEDPNQIGHTPYKDSTYGDEIQLSCSVFDFNPPIELLELPDDIEISAENLFANDKFEVTSAVKHDLIYDYNPKYVKSYKAIAKLIHEHKISKIIIQLKGWNIGVKVDKSDKNPNHIDRDKRFMFDVGLPPDNKKVRPQTLGWTEVAPSPSIADKSLDQLFHANDPKGEKTRLLEVPAWLPEVNMRELRYSYATVKLVPENSDTAIMIINIDSYVSPIWSRLDRVITTDYRHDNNGLVNGLSDQDRLDLLNSYTLYGDGSTGSDAYIKYIGVNGEEHIGSYNPILSCLRSIGLMQAIRDNIVYMAKQDLGSEYPALSETQAEDIKNFIETAMNTITIKKDVTIGYKEDITYDLFNKLIWYEDTDDQNLYGPTAE